MKPLHTSWLFGKWCAGCLRDILLCFLWLLLTATLLVQIGVITSSQLPLPDWMLRKIEARLDTPGLKVQVGHATIDPTGRLALRDVQLTPVTFQSPVITIENLHIRLRPLFLLTGGFDPLYVRARGLQLLLPAMFSATGQTEAVLSDIQFAFKPSAEKLTLDQCSGRLANLTVSLSGTIDRPLELFTEPGQTSKFSGLTPAQLRRYVDFARSLSRHAANLASFEQPHLSIQFQPDRQAHLVLTSRKLDTDLSQSQPRIGRLQAANLSLSTSLRLESALPRALQLRASCTEVTTSTGAQATDPSCRVELQIPPGTEPLAITSAVLAATSASLDAISLRYAGVGLRRESPSRLAVELATEAVGTRWQAKALLDPEAGGGEIQLSGAITPDVMQIAAPRIGMKPDDLLKVQSHIPLSLRVQLGRDWKLSDARGHVSSGLVTGYFVPLNATRADFTFDGTVLAFTDVHAVQGDNEATGIYWMNVKTLDFQFLLAGRLRPLDISGYFSKWWPNFWNTFDFSPAPAQGDVSVTGCWRRTHETTVFVRANATRPAIRGVHFDRLSTTMFIRPNFYHAFDLDASLGDGKARGTFTRAVEFHRPIDDLKYIDFDLTSNLNLAEAAKIFGEAGLEIVAPFDFAQPPDLRLSGRVDGPASGRGSHRNIRMELDSTGPFALYRFPLSDLSFKGTIRDDEINLSEVKVGFASGTATGTTRIYGPDTDRRLAFDGTLTGALLGEAINTLEGYAARNRGEAPPSHSRFQEQNAQGRLNLNLAAQGLYSDPFSFFGHGHMELTSAQLAHINLLGTLSRLLSKSPVFRFTTLQLKEARGSFVLERDKLTFPDLKITGTNAVIDTSGSYQLDKKTMDFSARLYPFGQGRNPLASAAGFLLVPVTNALELKLSGALDQPHWRFTYGPTNFLYNITGSKPNEQTPANPAPTDNDWKLPQPYRRQ